MMFEFSSFSFLRMIAKFFLRRVSVSGTQWYWTWNKGELEESGANMRRFLRALIGQRDQSPRRCKNDVSSCQLLEGVIRIDGVRY